MSADTIRCLCAQCGAFTEHTIPGARCTVCSAGLPDGADLARMGRDDACPDVWHADDLNDQVLDQNRLRVRPREVLTRLARAEGALRLVMNTRDQGAEGAPMPFAPGQAFDDWAADLASVALGANCSGPIQPDRLRELVSAARLVAYPDGHISPADAARFKFAVDAFDEVEV